MRPYYYIHNQNGSTRNDILPTNPIKNISELGIPDGTDMTGDYKVTSNGYVIYTSIKKQDVGGIKLKYAYYEGKYYRVNRDFDPSNPGEPLEGENLKAAQEHIAQDDTTAVMCYPDPEDTVGMIKDGTIQPGSNLPRTFKLDFGNTTENVSLVEKPTGLRAGNPSNVRMEIRYGKLRFLIFSQLNSNFTLGM